MSTVAGIILQIAWVYIPVWGIATWTIMVDVFLKHDGASGITISLEPVPFCQPTFWSGDLAYFTLLQLHDVLPLLNPLPYRSCGTGCAPLQSPVCKGLSSKPSSTPICWTGSKRKSGHRKAPNWFPMHLGIVWGQNWRMYFDAYAIKPFNHLRMSPSNGSLF